VPHAPEPARAILPWRAGLPSRPRGCRAG